MNLIIYSIVIHFFDLILHSIILILQGICIHLDLLLVYYLFIYLFIECKSMAYSFYYLGYRGKQQMIQILNDPTYYQNAAFLGISHENMFKNVKILFLVRGERRSFYVGGRFLSQCEVSFLRETTINILRPWENLNDIMYVLDYHLPLSFVF